MQLHAECQHLELHCTCFAFGIARQRCIRSASGRARRSIGTARLRGWLNTVGNLIELFSCQNSLSRASTYWYMRENQRGTVSSNSRFRTVLFQQYSHADLSRRCCCRGSAPGRRSGRTSSSSTSPPPVVTFTNDRSLEDLSLGDLSLVIVTNSNQVMVIGSSDLQTCHKINKQQDLAILEIIYVSLASVRARRRPSPGREGITLK